jgi:hypothetical protein
MQECSTKYDAAKKADALDGMSWNDFRSKECGADASPTFTPKKVSADATGLTMAECSAKYQAAKTGGTLKGQTWNDFRKTACAAGADDDDTVPSADEASYGSEPEKPTTVAPKGLKFPTKVAAKYANDSPGTARMHTCLDAYYAAKDANALGGLKWIQKGGGFYSLCNDKLKG